MEMTLEPTKVTISAHLCFSKMKGCSQASPLTTRQIPFDIKSWLQLEDLTSGKNSPRFLLPFARAVETSGIAGTSTVSMMIIMMTATIVVVIVARRTLTSVFGGPVHYRCGRRAQVRSHRGGATFVLIQVHFIVTLLPCHGHVYRTVSGVGSRVRGTAIGYSRLSRWFLVRANYWNEG